MYIIDSNILAVELLSKYQMDDITKKTLGFYRKVPLMKRVIADFIVNEFELYIMHAFPLQISLGVSEKNLLHDVVVTYLRQISNSCTIIAPSRAIVKNAFSLYQQYKSDTGSNYISFTDSLLLSTAIQLQYTIISLDSSLLTYAKELHISCFEAITAKS